MQGGIAYFPGGNSKPAWRESKSQLGFKIQESVAQPYKNLAVDTCCNKHLWDTVHFDMKVLNGSPTLIFPTTYLKL